jgi:hypothetical protein
MAKRTVMPFARRYLTGHNVNNLFADRIRLLTKVRDGVLGFRYCHAVTNNLDLVSISYRLMICRAYNDHALSIRQCFRSLLCRCLRDFSFDLGLSLRCGCNAAEEDVGQ